MKNKIKSIIKILVVTAGCLMFASFSPSLDGRAVVVDEGVFPQGLFAKTVGYLPGDIISVTNIAGDTTVDILVIGALDPSEGVAIMLSPEAAKAMGIDKGANNIVKITKRSGQDERVYGNAVITKSTAEIEDWDDGSFENISAEENTDAFDEPEENLPEAEEEAADETEAEAEAENEIAEEAELPEESEEDFAEEDLEEEEFDAEAEAEEETPDETADEEIIAGGDEKEAEEYVDETPEEIIEKEETEELPEENAEEETSEEAFEDEAPDALPAEEFEEETLDEEEDTEEAEAEVEEETPVEEELEEEAFEDEEPAPVPVEESAEEEAEETEETDIPEEEGFDEEAFDAETPDELPIEEETEAEPEEEPAEEDVPSAEAFEADELESLPEESEEEAEPEVETEPETEEAEESEEYEAIVLVPADSNPPESDSDEDEVEDVVEENEIESIDEIILTPLPAENKGKQDIAPIAEVKPEVKAPSVTETSYDKYIVPSLKDLESGKYYIQIAVYSSDDNILEVINKYGTNYPVTIVPMAGGKSKQVLIGPVTMDEYKVVLERFKSYGFKDAFLRKVR